MPNPVGRPSLIPGRRMTQQEYNERYKASEAYRRREAGKRRPEGITTDERITWQRQRVEEARQRLIDQAGTVYEALWRAVVEARTAELERMEAVRS